MNYKLHVNNISAYDILINDSYVLLCDKLLEIYGEKFKNKKICIITDINVSECQLESFLNVISAINDNVFAFSFVPGEHSKTIYTINDIYSFLIEHSFDRSDILIALGGGIVGDMTGFAASSYMRGIDFIQIPTTLLSQVDSSVGGKTGINFKEYKNMVGAFYNPKLVYINTESLKTLTKRDFVSGLAEVVKYAFIKNKDFFDWIKTHIDDIMNLNSDALTHLIYESCEAKRLVVESDFKESGERMILNFGHTIGHAIENDCDFKLFHGECVALGMCCALYISKKLGNISDDEYESSIKLISDLNLPIKYDIQNKEQLFTSIHHDKKNHNGKLKFTILSSFGKATTTDEVSDELIDEALSVLA
ncbi:MAG: 3-dehydroquinate synthase [Parasporobacterium sp.]|nr:3-dehydroquinate synthase [Parasporobacterium sp.]